MIQPNEINESPRSVSISAKNWSRSPDTAAVPSKSTAFGKAPSPRATKARSS